MGALNRKHRKDSALLQELLSAVRKNCISCAGGTREETQFCSVLECPLWEWRFGRSPAEVEPSLLDKRNFEEDAKYGVNRSVSELAMEYKQCGLS